MFFTWCFPLRYVPSLWLWCYFKMAYININHLKISAKRVCLSFALIVDIPSTENHCGYLGICMACIALLLWMFDGNELLGDSRNLAFVYISTCLFYMRPSHFYSTLQTLNLNACIISWGGGKEWGKVSNHSICICKSENVDELCIL